MSQHYRTLTANSSSYFVLVLALTALALFGLAAAHYMESEGHWITGMNNQIVWGLPHVFAISLILSASGALNVASMASLFGKTEYSAWSRFSGLLAISLLMGGLLVLVLDLGRPDRLIVAITHYNFKSIFAWNIFLYTGFIVLVAIYLWFLFERKMNQYVKVAGLFAFGWRFILTAGTGSIFGFIVARQFYHSAMMIPLFIVLSLSLGTSVFILVTQIVGRLSGSFMKQEISFSLLRLLGLLLALEGFLICAFYLTGLYSAARYDVVLFVLINGGIYTFLFWAGQIVIGTVVPLGLIFLAKAQLNSSIRLVSATVSKMIGSFCLLYVMVIAGQSYPQLMFPGKQIRSTFFDGVVVHYAPSWPELALGMGGVAVVGIIILVVTRVLPFLPVEEQRAQSSQ
ncbi:MAG: polysulfide reductase NrfD [Gammaproteobacteria bacterium]|nr:polysulfide reductase NrfD [Gammaproteobacteria bacterium]MCY4219564.1 polysulfide reductase NrfD [Gammaproteobacteria bacterium]